MNHYNMRGALKQYSQIGSHTAITDASPHRLIQMLMEGALDKIVIAKGHMLRGSVAEKASHINWAISIIDGLRASLNPEAGGEIANNLDSLYEYMNRRLIQANAYNDATILDEVADLLREIKSGWDGIGEVVEHGRTKAQVQPITAGI